MHQLNAASSTINAGDEIISQYQTHESTTLSLKQSDHDDDSQSIHVLPNRKRRTLRQLKVAERL